MSNIRSLTFQQAIQLANSIGIEGALYENGIFVVNEGEPQSAERLLKLFSLPIRLGFFALVSCTSGEADFVCDMKHYDLHSQSLFICPSNAVIQLGGMKSGRISVVFMEERFMQTINPNIQKIVPHIKEFNDNMSFTLTETQSAAMKKHFELVHDAILSPHQNSYYNELVRSLILSLTYVVLSILSEAIESRANNDVSTRQEQHFTRFTQLLKANYKRERSTKFYAEQMSLTPKYLGTIITNITGRKASEWINDFVMIEAKRLLKNTPMTIQEISIELNFPNQSFFGRYFKHHAGISPNQFRKSK